MKVAIFSDVHGNLTAFEAVLADIKGKGPDLIFYQVIVYFKSPVVSIST